MCFFVLSCDGESTGAVGRALQWTFKYFCSSFVGRICLWVNQWGVKVFDLGRYIWDVRLVTDIGGEDVRLLCQQQAQLV